MSKFLNALIVNLKHDLKSLIIINNHTIHYKISSMNRYSFFAFKLNDDNRIEKIDLTEDIGLLTHRGTNHIDGKDYIPIFPADVEEFTETLSKELFNTPLTLRLEEL